MWIRENSTLVFECFTWSDYMINQFTGGQYKEGHYVHSAHKNMDLPCPKAVHV